MEVHEDMFTVLSDCLLLFETAADISAIRLEPAVPATGQHQRLIIVFFGKFTV